MRKKPLLVISILVVLTIVIGGILISSKKNDKSKGPSCSVSQGEWMPARGECPGESRATQVKCDEFCTKHPDCCEGQNKDIRPGGQVVLPLPSTGQISSLRRIYPKTIKAINEGPNIYSRTGPPQIYSEEKLKKIKSIGFNTVQIYLIGKNENGKLVFDEQNNSVLLNDIVAIKKQGLAVWVALTVFGASVDKSENISNYTAFKSSFLNFSKDAAILMEKYQVEYLTLNNEPDKPFREQNWSTQEKNNNLSDFLVATNLVARKEFKGKLINKITQVEKHTEKVIAASFANVDIAGLDVGPPMDSRTTLQTYREAFNSYQYYAAFAAKAGVSWMNGEYWQGDFDNGYTDFAKNHELEYAKISFDAYLKTEPKGAGYVWNDLATFSLPQGEVTQKALSDFFSKI